MYRMADTESCGMTGRHWTLRVKLLNIQVAPLVPVFGDLLLMPRVASPACKKKKNCVFVGKPKFIVLLV